MPTVPVQRKAPVTPAAPVTPPKRPAVVDACTCGHAKAAHEHYRAGADCGVCGATACSAFHPADGSGSRRPGLLRRALGGR